MADLEALSAPNRSIWQPISYMNPIDTYVGNKGKLSALKATDLEFQKADQKLAIDDALQNSAKSLAVDNPAMQQYLANHRARIDDIATNIKDPYELNRQIKKASTQFANELSDPNSFLGSTGTGLKNYQEGLAKAETENQKDIIEYSHAKHRGAELDPETKSYAASTYKTPELVKELGDIEHVNKLVAGYTPNQSAWANAGVERITKKDANGNPIEGQYIFQDKGTHESISFKQAESVANSDYANNTPLKTEHEQQALAKAIQTLKGSYGNYKDIPEDQLQQLTNQYKKEAKDNYINTVKRKLAFDKYTTDKDLKEDQYGVIDAKAKAVSAITEQPILKVTAPGGNYNNVDQVYLPNSKDGEKQGNFINYKGKDLYPEDVAKQLYSEGTLNKKEYDAAVTIMNNRTKGNTLGQIFSNLNPFSQGQETGLTKTEEALLFSKLNKIGALNVKENKNGDLSNNEYEWIVKDLSNTTGYQNMRNKVKQGLMSQEDMDKSVKQWITNDKDKLRNKYNDYTSKIASYTSSGSKDDETLPESKPVDDLPEEFRTNNFHYSVDLGGKQSKDEGKFEDFKKTADIQPDDKVTYQRIRTNHNVMAGGKEWKIIVKDKNGNIKNEATAITEPPNEVKALFAPLERINKDFKSASPETKYYIFDSKKGFKSLTPDEKDLAEYDGKANDIISVSPLDMGTHIDAVVHTKDANGNPRTETLTEFGAAYERSISSELSNFNYTGVDKKARLNKILEDVL